MKTREEIIIEASRIRAEIRQIFIDAAAWNVKHPEAKPINPDPKGELKMLFKSLPTA